MVLEDMVVMQNKMNENIVNCCKCICCGRARDNTEFFCIKQGGLLDILETALINKIESRF